MKTIFFKIPLDYQDIACMQHRTPNQDPQTIQYLRFTLTESIEFGVSQIHRNYQSQSARGQV